LIKLTVQGYLTFKKLIGKQQASLPAGSSLRDSLTLMQRDLGWRFEDETFYDAGRLSGRIVVLLNGMHYRHLPEGLDTILKDGDQVAIFPPLVGG
jgi:molybdopterin converting factor small subunit